MDPATRGDSANDPGARRPVAAHVTELVRHDRGLFVVEDHRDGARELADERVVAVDPAVEHAHVDSLPRGLADRPVAGDPLGPVERDRDRAGGVGGQAPGGNQPFAHAAPRALSRAAAAAAPSSAAGRRDVPGDDRQVDLDEVRRRPCRSLRERAAAVASGRSCGAALGCGNGGEFRDVRGRLGDAERHVCSMHERVPIAKSRCSGVPEPSRIATRTCVRTPPHRRPRASRGASAAHAPGTRCPVPSGPVRRPSGDHRRRARPPWPRRPRPPCLHTAEGAGASRASGSDRAPRRPGVPGSRTPSRVRHEARRLRGARSTNGRGSTPATRRASSRSPTSPRATRVLLCALDEHIELLARPRAAPGAASIHPVGAGGRSRSSSPRRSSSYVVIRSPHLPDAGCGWFLPIGDHRPKPPEAAGDPAGDRPCGASSARRRSSGSSRPAEEPVEDLGAFGAEAREALADGERLVEARDRIVGDLLVELGDQHDAAGDRSRSRQQFRVSWPIQGRIASSDAKRAEPLVDAREHVLEHILGVVRPGGGTPGWRSPRRTGRKRSTSTFHASGSPLGTRPRALHRRARHPGCRPRPD